MYKLSKLSFKGNPLLTRSFLAALAMIGVCLPVQAQYLGNYSSNPYAPNSLSNPYGAGNPYGSALNPYAPNSLTNPYATTSPQLYDSKGNFAGNLNNNQFDPNSVSNPYGRYGSSFSPDSINNPFGPYGSPFSPESPRNPYGQGLRVIVPR